MKKNFKTIRSNYPKNQVSILKRILLILFVSVVFSCGKKIKSTNKNSDSEVLVKNNIQQATINQTSQLVPNGYTIQYEAKGDLNNDGLQDIVLVVAKRKEQTLSKRKILIYTQDVNQNYRLDKTSENIMPEEYIEEDITNTYDIEDISITNGELHIELFGVGPNGNLFSHFKYFEEDLVLTYIETYNIGAGSHQTISYNVLKGEFEKEILNTMEEDMPSESESFNLKEEKYLFKNTSPYRVLENAFNKIDSLKINKLTVADSVKTGENIESINAYIKDVYKINDNIYVDIDVVLIEYVDVDERKIINNNPKIRTYLITNETNIISNSCKSISPLELLEIKQDLLNEDSIILIGESKNGKMVDINFGCYG